jgi:hypothetical protein
MKVLKNIFGRTRPALITCSLLPLHDNRQDFVDSAGSRIHENLLSEVDFPTRRLDSQSVMTLVM